VAEPTLPNRGGPAAQQRIGKYEIVRELGRGATSSVLLALDPFTDRHVALKVVDQTAISNDEFGKRYRKLFLAEAALVGKLAHPHIVNIYDAVSDDDCCFIVMEYVDGGTLANFCQVDRLLPIDRVAELAFKSCMALDYAHRHGVVHRDIKPANILLTGDFEIKISDFGAALDTSAQTTQVSGIGSPAYMSPEQVRELPLNHQTDIFSLGVVMYQLLTGKLPFQASSNYGIVYQIINIDPAPPSLHRASIPPELDAIVARAMRKELKDRYASWDAFAQELVRVFGFMNRPGHDLAESEKFDVLRQLAFFRGFADVELWEVLRISIWNYFPAGRVVLQEGSLGTSFFIIARGDVKVSKHSRLLTMLATGECFGEMAYLQRERHERSATVTALADVVLIEIPSESLAAASEACRSRFHQTFLHTLVDRLTHTNSKVSELLAEHSLL
jgi:serine/threonine protein kinase